MAIRTVTGSTDTPVQDGTTRGMLFAALVAVLAFVSNKTDWLTSDDLTILTPVLVFLSFFLAGLFDRYVKPRL